MPEGQGFITLSLYFGGRRFADAAVGVQNFIELQGDAWNTAAQAAAGALRDYLNHVAEIVAARHSGGSTTATTLSRRSGHLVQSIVRSVRVEGTTWDQLQGHIGSTLRYAPIHEFGGVIHAGDKLLAIPLPAALQGSTKTAVDPGRWRNTFVAKSRRGNLIIFQRRGREIVPLYVLKSSVKIPARLGLRQTLQQEVPYFLGRLADAVTHEFEEKLGVTT